MSATDEPSSPGSFPPSGGSTETEPAGGPFSTPAPTWSEATVLVVDDHAPSVTLLEILLRSAGVRTVTGITDPTIAVSRCLAERPDLILLDLHMSRLDGFAVMNLLRAALRAEEFMPVIVLTADTSRAARKRALAAGAKDFLTKPFDRTEVLLRVRNVLETRALYRELQRHNIRLQAELDEKAQHQQRLENEREARRRRIETALGSGVMHTVFQPIAALDTGRVAGVEALTRFECEPRRPPNEWFAEATEVGLGAQLELAACATALRGVQHLPPEMYLSVNLSPATVTTGALPELLTGLAPDRLVIELTEHWRVDTYELLLGDLVPLRDHGVRLAVDDAGAGYSGLQHILRLHPDIIKLDTGLTRGIDHDPVRRALTAALLMFARDINATLVAEGIETPGELSTLQTLGVPWGQGYQLARPGPLPLPAPYVAVGPSGTGRPRGAVADMG